MNIKLSTAERIAIGTGALYALCLIASLVLLVLYCFSIVPFRVFLIAAATGSFFFIMYGALEKTIEDWEGGKFDAQKD